MPPYKKEKKKQASVPSRGFLIDRFPKHAAGLHLGASVHEQHASNLRMSFPEMETFIDRITWEH